MRAVLLMFVFLLRVELLLLLLLSICNRFRRAVGSSFDVFVGLLVELLLLPMCSRFRRAVGSFDRSMS